MKKHRYIYFKFQNYNNPVTTLGGFSESIPCKTCGRSKITWRYDNLVFQFGKLKNWPLIFGGLHHTAVSHEVVEAFDSEKITGVRFHPLKGMDASGLQCLSNPPSYFIMEPIGVVDIIIPWDEFNQCESCGVIVPSKFGEFNRPFEFDWNTWDGSDLVNLRNVYPQWICVNRKVVDLFRKRGWEHQLGVGRQNRKFESLIFGGNPVPGISVRNIDSDIWYEDTLVALREKYPGRE